MKIIIAFIEGNYEHQIVLPDSPTNGDVIKAIFPNLDVRFDKEENIYDVGAPSGFTAYTPFAAEWWDARYKKGGAK